MSYYWGALVGCYTVVWVEAIGSAVTWQTPIFWAAWVAVIEGSAWIVRRAWRKRKGSPTTPPHPSPKPIPGESDTATPMERQTGAEANGERDGI